MYKKINSAQLFIGLVIFICFPVVITSTHEQNLIALNSYFQEKLEPESQFIHRIYESHIVQSLQPITMTNPIGIVATVTMVATMLIMDTLATKDLIDTKWSFTQCKEKIFGIPMYEGEHYYKNWSHPKNIERVFPKIPYDEIFFANRYAYEQEMTASLHQLQDVMQCQVSLQKLAWPHVSCKKLLEYKLVPDYIFISENEELQLDVRLKQELANCRASSVRNIKNERSQLCFIFEQLGNEVVYQLKKIWEDLKKFKIDPRLVVILSCLGIGISEGVSNEYESDLEINSESYQHIFMNMSKKDLIKLFTNCSDYYALLEVFEQSLDLNDNFFMQYCTQIEHFTNNEKQSLAIIVKTLKAKIAIKKDLAQICLKEIDTYCKKINQSKIITNLTKSLKKSVFVLQKNYNKKIDERLRLNAPVIINVQDLLSLDFLLDCVVSSSL